jgi:signal transduction histidine kinase
MRLRSRLVLALLLTAVPLVAGLVWLRDEVNNRAASQMLVEVTRYRVEALGRKRCEADPQNLGRPFGIRIRRSFPPPPGGPAGGPPRGEGGEIWMRTGPPGPRLPPEGGPWEHPPGPSRGPFRFGRPLETFAYDAQFRAESPDAPSFPETLRRRLSGGDESASTTEREEGQRWQVIGLSTGWNTGPCAYILVRGKRPPHMPREAGFIWSAAALSVGLVAAVWIAAGPIIRRVRRLAREVRRSAATQYEQPVPVEGGDEVSDLARAFNAAGEEVRTHLMEVAQREEALRSFLANTTHDLAIPLSVLLGHLSTMRRTLAAGHPVSDDQVAAAADEASHLGALVHNLGAVAKLEAGEGLVRHDRVDLGKLLERVIERHRPLATSRSIEIASAIPPDAAIAIEGDLTLLEQALGNLVANAVLYNRPGGHVAATLEAPRAEPPLFRLRVVDDGPGVGEAELPRLGERHFRGTAGRARHAEGQGLGLHIARQVAARHGFTLTFAPADGGGLAATMEGPIEKAPPA